MAITNRKPGKSKPISSHPLFPAVVALWFGALLGLGSLAIRPTLLEAVVLKTGLDLIIPAAAPPLGITARILIALAMAAAGAVLGAVLALRIGRDRPAMHHRRRGPIASRSATQAGSSMWNNRNPISNGVSRRPISAHEELGEALVARRRPLAVEHEDRPFAPPEFAPLPGGDLPSFDAGPAAPDATTNAAPLGEGPLDLGAFPAPAPVEPVMAPPQLQPQSLPPQLMTEARQQFAAPAFIPPMAEAPVQDPLPGPATVGITDLAQRLQETMSRSRAGFAAAEKPQPPEPSFAPPPVAPSLAPAPAAVPAPALASTPPAEPEFVPPPPLTNLFNHEPADIEPPFAQAPARAPIPVPAALRPVSLDLTDDEDPGELAHLMPRHLSMPAGTGPAVAAEQAPDEAEPEQEDAFASLLQPRAQPRQEFVRIEEPESPAAAIEPVVIFPGQMANATAAQVRPFDVPADAAVEAPVAPPRVDPAIDPGDAERALRLALASLQRISGAA